MTPDAPPTSDSPPSDAAPERLVGGDAEATSATVARAPAGGSRGRWCTAVGGLVAVFSWLLWGDFAWQLKERALNPVGLLVLKQFGATNLVIGLLIGALPAALGMILGPVVCTQSDRHRGRWGRRIPYLLWPTPLVVAAMVGLAFTPELGAACTNCSGPRSPGPAAAALMVFSFFWTVSEVAAITAQFLFYGLINDVVPRELHGRFFGMFRAVSLLAGIVFNLWVIGHTEAHFRAVFIGLAVIYGVGITTMCLRMREGEYPPPEPLPPSRKGDRLAPVRTYFRESFSDPSYVWLYAGTTLAVLAFLPVNTFNVPYAKSIGMGMETYGRYLVLTYVISFALSYLLGWLADRFHPLPVGIGSIGIYAVVDDLGRPVRDDAGGVRRGVRGARRDVRVLLHRARADLPAAAAQGQVRPALLGRQPAGRPLLDRRPARRRLAARRDRPGLPLHLPRRRRARAARVRRDARGAAAVQRDGQGKG